ncbi:MAG: sigma-54 dependent transcriptional regulator [Thermodesulfobacteriota bacterium]
MNILVIDDEESMRHMLSVMLAGEGFKVSSSESATAALKLLKKEGFDFILCDVRMPEMGGLEFLTTLGERRSDQTVIMMSAYGTIDVAMECMKLGAYDYISKPFKSDEILLTIRKATERECLKRENIRLKSSARREIDNIITDDGEMNSILKLVSKISSYDTTVLVTGDSGTGKELIARAIHFSGSRADGPFIAINCGAIPSELIESEFFGYVKGAFTDATKNKSGLFQEADKGTIFLDEVGDLPFGLQVKLLRVLEEREVRRVGDTESTKIDVRVVAATAKDLSEEIKKGGFREDLFYRLNVISIALPPLSEREGDVRIIASHFASLYSEKFGKDIKGISEKAMDELTSYSWPGNVRELENVMERAVILEDSDMISEENLPFKDKGGGEGASPAFSGLSIKKASEALERDLIAKALIKTGGNKTRASKILEISHRALLYKIKNYEL